MCLFTEIRLCEKAEKRSRWLRANWNSSGLNKLHPSHYRAHYLNFARKAIISEILKICLFDCFSILFNKQTSWTVFLFEKYKFIYPFSRRDQNLKITHFRTWCPRKAAWILTAASSVAGSLRSMSETRINKSENDNVADLQLRPKPASPYRDLPLCWSPGFRRRFQPESAKVRWN